MKKLLFLLTALLTVSISGNAQLVRLWDFSGGIYSQKSDFDVDTPNWSYDSGGSRYDNTGSYRPQNQELMVNGKKITMTEGLKFNITANSQRIRLTYKNDKNNSVLLNGKGQSVIIPELKKGQIVEIDCRSGKNDTDRTFSFTNLKKYRESDFAAGKLRVVHRGIVLADGDVTLTTAEDANSGGGMHIYSIAVFEPEPINSLIWDFTKILDADKTALATDAGDGGDGKWQVDNNGTDTRYSTTASYSAVTEALQANRTELALTSGLKFTFEASDKKVSIYPNNVQAGLQMRASNVELIIPDLKKGTRIFMPIRSGSQGNERGFTATNFTLDEGSSLKTSYNGYITGVATADGNVIFRTTGGMNVRWLTVSPPTVTFETTGYATYSDNKNIDLSITDTNMKAYYAKSYSANSVALSETTKFAANEGIILTGEPDEPYFLYEALENVDADGENLMKPNLTATELSQTETIDEIAYTNFILVKDGDTNNVKFAKVDGTSTLAANKAYLQLPTASLSSARELKISFADDETTGIENAVKSEEIKDNSCYDLQGRRVQISNLKSQTSNLKKGLYIVNGKKLVVK